MLAVAQSEKGRPADRSAERQLGRALAEPFTLDRLTFRVVIARGEVLAAIGFGHGQVELDLGSYHRFCLLPRGLWRAGRSRDCGAADVVSDGVIHDQSDPSEGVSLAD